MQLRAHHGHNFIFVCLNVHFHARASPRRNLCALIGALLYTAAPRPTHWRAKTQLSRGVAGARYWMGRPHLSWPPIGWELPRAATGCTMAAIHI